MHVFARSIRSEFIGQLARDMEQRWPAQAGEGFRERVAAMVERALGYGFRDRGQIAEWVELELRYGTGFEERPEHAAVRNVLAMDLGGATKLYKVRRRLEPEEEE
jgi:hypothetical protein